MSIYDQSKDYFLGHLPESEQLNFEEDYFSNPEALMALRAACDDLIDDYLRGKLAPQEHLKFEQRLNELPALREKVENDRALLQALESARQTIALEKKWQLQNSTPHWSLAKLWAEIRFPTRLALAITALIILAGGIGYFLKLNGANKSSRPNITDQIAQQREAPTPLRPLPDSTPTNNTRHPASSVSPPPIQHTTKNQSTPVSITFLLSAETTRGAEDTVTLLLAPNITTMQLQLELSAAEYRHYRVVLQTSIGKIVRNWERLPVVRQKPAQLVRISLPADAIASDDYSASLYGLSEDGKAILIHKYHFSLDKN